MHPTPALPPHRDLVDELRHLRQRGLPRLRHCPRQALRRVAAAAGLCTGADDELEGVEMLLGAAVRRLAGGGPLRDTAECDPLARAAAHSFGLFAERRGVAAADRRKAAAAVYGVSTERFRKSQEREVVDGLASALLALAREVGRPAGPGTTAGIAPPAPAAGAMPPEPPSSPGLPRGVQERITVLASPIELAGDIDILVSSENVYLEMSKTFRPTVSGALRRAAAIRDSSGEIVDDVLTRELAVWLRINGRTGLPVRPGTVVGTSAGALARRGIRRVHHAAVATPVEGSDHYHVAPATVAEAVRASFTLARQESQTLGLSLSSICFPLLGSGRGGLPAGTAARWLLWAVREELRRDPGWSVYLAAPHPEHATLLTAANSAS
ncbi:macro domain-containing protein [Streptomyces sp. HK10]|uniref:macro domain-containing protein n=1 Tax=Streptomyces sp. HK10 TaxID=3373255 RepID=UPI0037488EFA